MKKFILLTAIILTSSTQAQADWGSMIPNLFNSAIGLSGGNWGQVSGAYAYEDGVGLNVQFTNTETNVVTTLSLGADGNSSSSTTSYSGGGAGSSAPAGTATNTNTYNSAGTLTGVTTYDSSGVGTTYNQCGQVGSPGEACDWTNPDTGAVVHVSASH